MNDIINNILTRRSVRDFSEKQVSKDDLELLIKCGLYAPSGMGKQTWKFTGITNKSVITELADLIAKLLQRNGYNFYKAPALILVSNEDTKWCKEDNACALQNIMLAAHSMNIGSVWINQLQDICDNEEVRSLLTKLNVPSNHNVTGIAALGYSLSDPKGIVDKKGIYEIIE